MAIELNNNKRMGLQHTERKSLTENENQTAIFGLYTIVEECGIEKLSSTAQKGVKSFFKFRNKITKG